MRMEQCPDCLCVLNILEPGDEALRRDPGVIKDKRFHSKVHDRRVQAYAQVGVVPLLTPIRKALVEDGMELLASGADLPTRVRGAEMMIDGAYAHSLERQLDRPSFFKHPSRAEYAAKLDLANLFPEDVAAQLRAKYGPPNGRRIDTFSMMWSPR